MHIIFIILTIIIYILVILILMIFIFLIFPFKYVVTGKCEKNTIKITAKYLLFRFKFYFEDKNNIQYNLYILNKNIVTNKKKIERPNKKLKKENVVVNDLSVEKNNFKKNNILNKIFCKKKNDSKILFSDLKKYENKNKIDGDEQQPVNKNDKKNKNRTFFEKIKLVFKLKKEALNIIKIFKPNKYNINMNLGFKSPFLTAKIFSLLIPINTMFKQGINLLPNFKKEIHEGDLYLKGNPILIKLIPVLYRAWKIAK